MKQKKKIAFDALPALKADIREFVLGKRDSLPKKQIKSKSAAIAKKLFSLPEFKKAKTIFTYVSFGSEADTKHIVEKCIASGKKVAIPCADMKSKNLGIFEFTSYSSLRKSTYGILEPVPAKSKKVPASEIDFVVVPGVAFDKKCNRIGYGLGFYDRFFSKHRKIPNAALAFELQVLGSVPAGKKDGKVHGIITEKRAIKCGKI